MTPAWKRATRGLIQRVHAMDTPPSTRVLVGYCPQPSPGTCSWCKQPSGHPRSAWHDECVVTYLVARGQTRRAGTNQRLIRRSHCGLCGRPWDFQNWQTTFSVDHKIPLGWAKLMHRRWWIKAWHVSNLWWLCESCHKIKTRLDMQAMSQLKRGIEDEKYGQTVLRLQIL